STKTPERSLSSSTADHTAGVTGKGGRCYRGQTRTRRPNRSARPVRRCGLVLNMAPTAGLGHVGVLYYTPDASEASCTNTGVFSAHLAQLAEALGLGPRCWGFESLSGYKLPCLLRKGCPRGYR